MENFLYPIDPARCNRTGPSECGKSVFLTNLILTIMNKYDKLYIFSPSLHQDLYQKLIKCFSNYIPIHIIPNTLNEEDINLVNEEVVSNKAFEKSDTEIETYESIEEINFPQEYDDGGTIILDDLEEKKWMILEFKQCLKDLDIIIYLFFKSVKNIMSYLLSLLMLISITFLNRTISEM